MSADAEPETTALLEARASNARTAAGVEASGSRVFDFARVFVIVAAGLLIFALAARFAWLALHSSFGVIDDEGYVMVSIANFERGHALYDEVYTLFGPFYYMVA